MEEGMIIPGLDGGPILLSREQESCINFKGNRTQLVVKGVAGSGKSIVLMAKAKKIVETFSPGVKNEMAVLSYTNSLSKNASDYLDPRGQMRDFATICTFDSYIWTVIRLIRHLEGYPAGEKVSDEERENILAAILKKRGRKSDHRFYRFRDEHDLAKKVAFWSDEIEWMMGLGITEKDWATYIRTPRTGRGHSVNMDDDDRREAFAIYKNYTQTLKEEGLYERMQMHIFVSKHVGEIPDNLRFNHVFIDEAQDFPLIDMRIAIGLARKDIMIAMDANQRLYKHYWKMSDLGIGVTPRYLKQSFRCTAQIDEFAEALRIKNEGFLDQDDICAHVAPAYQGDKPLVIETEDEENERHVILYLVREFLKDPRGTTAIILRTREEVDQWSEYFASKSIKHDIIKGKDKNWYREDTYSPRKPGLKICTINSAKGLEFHHVILPGFTNGRYPAFLGNRPPGMSEDEWVAYYRNLAYVAMTRAKINLVVTFYGNPSQFLDEIVEGCSGEELMTVNPEDNIFNYIHSSDLFTGNETLDLYDIVDCGSVKKEMIQNGPALNNQHPVDRTNQVSTKTFSELLTAAKSGDADYMYTVGHAYDSGDGVEINRKEAIRWYALGSELGDADCLLSYSKTLWDGAYVEKDERKSMALLVKSAEIGNPEAQFILANRLSKGECCNIDKDRALELYETSAKGGYLKAIEHLCEISEPKEEGSDESGYRAWLQKGSDLGSPECQYRLGLVLKSEGNPTTAFDLFKMAAYKNHVKAQYEVGKSYLNGEGTEKNEEQGQIWMRRAERTSDSLIDLRDVMLSSESTSKQNEYDERTSSDDSSKSQSGTSESENTGVHLYSGPTRSNNRRISRNRFGKRDELLELLDSNSVRYKDERLEKGRIMVYWHEELRNLEPMIKKMGYRMNVPRSSGQSGKAKWVKIERM